MNGPDILASLREELARVVQSHKPPIAEPLDISPWLAMSLLQKAIRRGHEQFALTAAATLIAISPDRLWRRCAVIAFEDIGVADLETVSLVVASQSGNAFRERIGGDWTVASYLSRRMVHAAKCRAADDLLMVAERHPAYERNRLDLTFMTTRELIDIATSTAPLPRRALALWFAIGTDKSPSRYLRTRRGEPNPVFDALCEVGLPHSVVELAREGFRKTGEMICPFLPMLLSLKPHEPTVVSDDDFPPEAMCGSFPSWAVDMFSRAGRKALAQFLATDCLTTRWIHRNVSPLQKIDFLGNILFAIESGLLRHRYRWQVADELRRLADVESQGPYCSDASEIMNLLRGDIALLNEVRRDVL